MQRLADEMMTYAARADGCATIAELKTLAVSTVARAGMDAIASGMITGPLASGPDVFHFNNWPEFWLERYRQRGYVDTDPLPRWAVISGAPARWSEVLAALSPGDAGRDIYADARAFGFHEGVITPVRTADGHLGLVSVGGARDAVTADEFTFLTTVSTATLHRAEQLRQPGRRLRVPSLSRREQECLVLLTQGLTEHDISARLGIRDVTVRFHLDNARVKTGARSRTHLAAIAGQWLTRQPASSAARFKPARAAR